jgi:phage/plasmid-like protein (TIGR03299 family)
MNTNYMGNQMDTGFYAENVRQSMGITKIKTGGETRLTVSEALKVAGADWTVDKAPIYDGFMATIPGYSRIVRSDMPNSTMNVCKNSYTPINNADVFGILDQILGETQAQIENVGCIKGGNVVFMQAKMPESIEVLQNDNMDMYINAITSHDGSHLARVFFSATRIACQNQLRALTKEGRKNRSISIRHTRNADVKIRNAANIIMDGVQEWEAIKENAKILAERSVDRQKTRDFIHKLFPAPEDASKKDMNRQKRQTMFQLVESGKGTDIPGVKGTAWGLYNAASEYFDHYATIKNDQSRFARSLIDGDKFRENAFQLALA